MSMTTQNRTVRLLTLLFSVLTFAPGAAVTESVVAESCVRTHGYWSKHAAQWPVVALVLGDPAFAGHTYQQSELLSLLKGSAQGDASLILAAQLIAAKLNVANGASAQPIAGWMTRADALLAAFRQRLPYRVKNNTPVGSDMVIVANVLEQFNSGAIAGSCASANTAPVANAGPAQTGPVGFTVTLDGSASSDVDGQALAFRWTFVTRPSTSNAVLSDPAAVRPTFVADVAGDYDVQLIVNDGSADSAPSVVRISTINSQPAADAGPDQTAPVGATIGLSGAASTDPDGDSLTFAWSIAERPAGSTADLINPLSAAPSLLIDQPGQYRVELIVADGALSSAPDSVIISTINSAPVARAGADSASTVGSEVTLDGSASTDVDGDELTYRWTLTSRPASSAATLTNATTVNPSFVADLAGDYVVELIVNDGSVDSAPDVVVVNTSRGNTAPVADAGVNQSAITGDVVHLDGSGSTDIDGDPLTFAWSFTSVPGASAAGFADPAAVKPTFTPDVSGDYIAQLIVSDPSTASAPATVTITVQPRPPDNRAPVAEAGVAQSVALNSVAVLDGSGSTDPDGDALTFAWSLLSRPAGSAAALSDPAAAGPSFTVDAPGTYVAQLIVNDGTVNSQPDTVSISTQNSAPVADAGDDVSVAIGATVQLDGNGSFDPDGSALTYAWSLTRPPGSSAVLSSPSTVNPTFVADVSGTFVAQLIVGDGLLASGPDTAAIDAAPGADLALTFFRAPSNPPVGESSDWGISAHNQGSVSPVAVQVSIPVPAGYTFVSASATQGSYDSTTGAWTIPALSQAAGVHLFLALRPNATGPYTITADVVSSTAPDPNPSNNRLTTTPTPDPNMNLGLSYFNFTPGTRTIGEEIFVIMDVRNEGPAAAADAAVELKIPAGFTIINFDVSVGSYDPTTGLWRLGNFARSGFARSSIRLRLNATGSIVLRAVATSTSPDSNPANNVLEIARMNRAPVANAGADRAGSTHALVTLDGTSSFDADGDPITFEWTSAIRPINSDGSMSGVTTATPSFTPDLPGDYVHRLVVRDSFGVASSPDSVTTTAVVTNRRPAFVSVPPTAAFTGQQYQYDATVVDPDAGDVLTFSLAASPAGMTINSSTGVIVWTPADDQAGQQNLVVRVQDTGGLFATQAVALQVASPGNGAPLAVDDEYSARVGESLAIDAPGVRANDTDESTLTTRLVAPPGNGNVIFNPDGSFIYTPDRFQEGEFVLAENVNLARSIPGVVVSGGTCGGFGGAQCAFDDAVQTKWESVGQPLEVVFPADVTVNRIMVVATGQPNDPKISGASFELFGADGTELYDSGPVEIPGPSFDATLILPKVQGVRRVRFRPTASPTSLFSATLAELRVIGSGLIRRERFVEPNLVQLLPTSVQSNSVGPNTAEGLIDDSKHSNWFANGNAGDFIEVSLPRDVTVTELIAANPNGRPDGFGTSLGISCFGRFEFFDAERNVLFDSGQVNEPSGGMFTEDTFTLSLPSIANVRHVRYTLAFCTGSFPAGFSGWRLLGSTEIDTPAFSMAKKFQSLGGREAHSTPIVVNLTDDNGDGVIDADDTPDIVVPVEAIGDQLAGDIKVLSGADGAELFTAGTGIVSPWSELAAGDIDLDGLPEIIAVHRGGNNLVAFEHTGALKWTSDANSMPRFFLGESALIGGAVSIANLDGAGAPEIIVGASVFDSQGRLIGDGRTLGGSTGGLGLRSAISSVADIDLDGRPELVAGPTAYRLVNGQLSVLWRRADRADGYVAIANLDDDPQAELVIVANGSVYALNHDGSDYQGWNAPSHTPIAIPGGGSGGAPLVVDVDGNGSAEIGVAGAGYFVLFNGDGSVRWRAAISDRSSNSTGAVAFDLNGDGEVEIIYRDEFFLRVYRGADGVLLARTEVGSATWAEEPVVADVDNDGHADIIVASDFFQQRLGAGDTGILVFQDVANKWKRTRRIWNQHAYHVTNVNEDATIPVSESAHWLVPGLNNFRTNAFVPGESTDETDSFTYVASDGVLESNTATVRIAIRTPNSGPQITSTPVTAAADGVFYGYAAQASDPDAGDILTFSLPTAPVGMSIDPASGLIAWTPTAAQQGAHSVVIKVADVRGLYALQSYRITVTTALTVPDVVGQIQATAESAIVSASLTIGAVTTRHTSGTPQGSVISQNPAGGSSAAAGTPVSFVVSLGPPPVGTVPNVVGLAQTAAQQDVTAAGFTSTATGQNDSAVPAGVIIGQTPAGGTIAPSTTVVGLVVSLGPPPGELDLDFDGFTGNQGDCNDTNAAINPAAFDVPGDGVDQNCNGVDSIAGDSTFPIASIESPAEDAVIAMPTDIIGTATDANFLRYQLQLAPADESVYSTIASGDAPVSGGVLGRVDPTRLENGIYRLRLVVEDANGQASDTERAYRVGGDAKVGILALSWVDVRVPVTGIPIRVIRSYDNRIKSQRDFGVGWELEVKAGKYQNNRRPGDGWRVETAPGPFGLPCSITTETRTHLTELRLSDREFYLFRPRLTALAAVVGGCVGSVVYDFVDGSMPGATLTVLGNTDIIYTSGDQIAEFDGSGNTGLIFDPLEVRLTTANGRVIDFKRGAGITRLEDDNGNTLSITDAGIAHSSGKSIAFARDAQGRITRVTEPSGATITYGYTGGDLTEVVDQLNNQTTFTYDGQHNLLDIHDPLGNRAMRSEFDADGRLIAMIDAKNQRIEFAHDLSNREEVVTDARGHATILQYDELGHMLAERRSVTIDGAPVVATTTFVTDARGNVLSTVDPDGLRIDAVYDHEDLTEQTIDPQGLQIRTSLTLDTRREPLSITDAVGNTMQFAYDRNGNLRTYTDPLGQSSVIAHDGSGRATAATDAAGIRRTGAYDNANNLLAEDVLDATGRVLLHQRYTYDANGNRLTATVYRTVDGGSLAHTTTYTYDAKNRVIAVTDPLGHTTRTRYNAVGLVEAQVDALGRETTHTYDEVGARIRTDYPDATFERFDYDAVGSLMATTDRAGRTTRFEYDELNRQTRIIPPGGEITQIVYTPGGRVAAVIDPLGKRTDYEYDAAGRRTRTLQPSVLDAAQGAQLRPELREEYDGNGRVTAVIDPNGRRTAFHWEGVERIIRRDFADGNSVHATYDALGRITERVDEAGRVTRFEYDGLGRLTRVIEPAPTVQDPNPVTRYAWDELGNLISATDAAGRVTTFAYDAIGRVVTRTLPGGGAERFTYDAVGNVVSHTDFNGRTTTFGYDVMDRLLRKTLPDGFEATFTYTATGQRASATDRRGATTYEYDANGRLARVNHPTGDVVSYRYDGAGRLARLESPGGVLQYEYDALGRLSRVIGPSGATQYGFDLAGNVVSVNGANGVSAEHQFDARNRLTNIRYARSGNTIGSFAYALSPTGRRLSMTTQDGSVETYGYDQLDRLRSEVRTGADPRSILYGYDAVGNRTSMLRNSTATFYAYDADHRLTSAGATSFTYDGNGNQLTQTTGGIITGYEWDAENRLIRAVGPSGTTEFAYDADGNRVGRTVNGVTTRTLLETATGLPQVLEERDAAGTLLAHHTYGIRRLSTTNGTTSSFYHQDGLGSTRLLTDGAGAVTDSYGYEAYGTLATQSGPTQNPYLFAGERFEAQLGLYDLRARNYAPVTGRFLGPDPALPKLGDPRSAHPFLYAHADPVNGTDPTGRSLLLELAYRFGIENIIRTAECGMKVFQGCRTVGLAQGYQTAAIIGVAGVMAGLAFDKAQETANNDHAIAAIPQAGLVLASFETKGGLGARINLEKAEFRIFGKSNQQGLFNGKMKPGAPPTDVKLVGAFDFKTRGPGVKIRVGYELMAGVGSLEGGVNFAPNGASFTVCGFEFFKIEVAVRGGLSGYQLRGAVGLEATILKLLKFQYPIFPPQSAEAGQ